MADPLTKILTTTPPRALVLAEDPWVRFRLKRELERAGCSVRVLTQLRTGEPAEKTPYDLVIADAGLFPEGSRLEALRALRAGSPQPRFVLLVPPGEKALAEQARHSGFDLVLERTTRAESLAELVREILEPARPTPALKPVSAPVHFDVLLELPGGERKRRAGSALAGAVLQALVLAVLVIVPMAFTETLDVRELVRTWVVAPPPPSPPPPPPAPATAVQVRPRRITQMLAGKLVAPTVIPKEIAQVIEAPELVPGVVGGVPGGIPGGQIGGVIGGVIGGIPTAIPKPVTPPKPIRVGGRVTAPRQIRRVDPVYPALARQARIEGSVRIDAVIDETGHVVEMKVLSGHPILVKAALDAVQQWVYEPTLLNDQAVPVVLEVTVNFVLAGLH